ncbi:Aste57867_506 [Aphanomyces stellatus]|uniref:Aste57867_506 protein n=1 Tax=Aphanomyces stellatus TaxID=120398 RepID=A0A485K5G5_9STRA|nr:hypothetical protein As57867_000505 [Aphanomyces stellatus]VFT77731.1 Aste57867_506 [Aphanomyces stellatus]
MFDLPRPLAATLLLPPLAPVDTMVVGKHPTALSQVLIVACTCFCCPGLFNALSSVAAGVSDETISYNATAVLYACFAVAGLFAGGIVNVIGPKWTLFIGTWGYVMYASSLLVMDKHLDKATATYSDGATSYFYAANAILGICAGFLWTAQGQMCMAYPTAETKGVYFSYFWIIFNLGGTMGGFITFGTNYDNNGGVAASTTTYVVFLVLMSLGACLSLLLANPSDVIRNDGSHVVVDRLPSPVSEIVETFKLFLDPKMLLLFPLFAYSNWFYNYHSFYNSAVFNSRTGGFASAFYWGAQMVGAYCIGVYLDRPGNKKAKALQSIALLATLIFVMWGLGLYAQLDLDLGLKEKKKNLDLTDGAFFVKFLLYFFYGFNDSICQIWSYWLLGQMSDDMATLGRYAGYYKCVQSGMAAVGWRLGGIPITPVANIVVNWSLATVGLVGAYLSVTGYLPDSSSDEFGDASTPEQKGASMAIH